MSASENDKTKESHDDHAKKFQIQIDRTHFTVTQAKLTGLEIRNLPEPPIPPERDLFEVVPGGSDRKIEDATIVEIRNGLRFFSAPGTINPGRSNEYK